MELLSADNEYADIMLHEERPNFGGLSIEELHRLVYAQVLSSHSLTWQASFLKLNALLNNQTGSCFVIQLGSCLNIQKLNPEILRLVRLEP